MEEHIDSRRSLIVESNMGIIWQDIQYMETNEVDRIS